ncbi:MAG: hypothetical protein AAF560_23450, partial [Acidobacteriota bacterium]
GELRRSLQGIRQETTQLVAPSLERLSQDLELDLARLEATRRQIAADAAAEAARQAAEADDAPAATPEDGSTPAPTASSEPGIQPLELQNPDWIADLRDASGRDETLAILAPIVEQLIIAPRYFDVGRSWREDSLPRLEARLDAAASAIPRLRGSFTEARTQWDALAGALNAFTRAARELTLTAPGEPLWWTLPNPDRVELGLASAVRDTIRRPSVLSDLETAADRNLEHFAGVNEALTEAKRQLGEASRVGIVAGFDLAFVMPMFPLLIGSLLAGASLWRSQRLRELELATRLAVAHGGPPALQRWLWQQTHWGATDKSAAAAWRSCVLQLLLGYFLTLGWIAASAVQLRGLQVVDRQQLSVFTVSAAVLVLLAVARRLAIARRATTPSVADAATPDLAAEGEMSTEDIPEMPLNEATASDSDSELIEVQTLRR